eukprot:5553554-Pyramimonas_sp.AAC.1
MADSVSTTLPSSPESPAITLKGGSRLRNARWPPTGAPTSRFLVCAFSTASAIAGSRGCRAPT